MDGLTEEQRRRKEINRQRALEKANQRRSSSGGGGQKTTNNNNNNNAGKEHWSHSRASMPMMENRSGENHAVGPAAAFDYNEASADRAMEASEPARESFGDGIDWDAAVGDADRLLLSDAATSNSRTAAATTTQCYNNRSASATTRGAIANDGGWGPIISESKRRKIETTTNPARKPPPPPPPPQYNSQKPGLSEEQRARMEENKRKALEKKQKTLTPPPKAPTVHNDDRRRRIEENRQRALAKKQQLMMMMMMSQQLKPSAASNNAANDASSSTAAPDTDNEYSDEQRARIEENRRRALEKKHHAVAAQLPCSGSATNIISSSSTTMVNEVQRARMEENKRRAFEKKQLRIMQQQSQKSNNGTEGLAAAAAAASNNPNGSVKSSSLSPKSFSNEQRARMEENRRKALEKKKHPHGSQHHLVTAPSVLPGMHDPAAKSNSAQQPIISPKRYSEEQLARMEENRRKALAKKQQLSPVPARPSAPVFPNSSLKFPPPNVCNDEQRARMEENRRKALEKKRRKMAFAAAAALTSAVPPSANVTMACHPSAMITGGNNIGSAQMGKTGDRVLEKKEPAPAPSARVLPKNAVKYPPPTICNGNQRAKMEENRLRALEKKGRATQPLVSAALTPAVTTASNSTAKTLFASTTTGGNRAAMGESGQKMLERKVQATAPSAPVLPNNSSIECPPPNTCHNKQKAGMEENQGIALEKKGPMTAQLPTAAVMSLAAATASVMTNALNGTTNNTCTSSTITGDNCAQMDNTGQTSLEFFASGNVFHYYEDEVGADTTCQMDKCSSPSRHNDKQPAQMKENQRRALEKTLPPSQPLATAASASVLPPSAKVAANSCPSSKITDDNCVKTGGNRQSGLKERKETSSSLKTSSEVDVPQNDDQCEPVMPAPVKMPCHTMGNEHKEADVPIEDQMTGVEEICHLDLEKPELEASMPSTDVCIDSNVTNNMNPPAEIMPAPSPPPGPPKVDPDEKASLTPTKTATTKMSPVKPASARKSALPPIPQELQYEHPRVLPIIDGDTDTLIKNAELDQPLLNGMTLYEHQKEGVKRALRMRRLILAFDMGLGKTIIGCVWAKAFLKTFEGIKIFVIAPVSLQGEWKNNAVEATGLKAVLKVDLDEKKKKKKKVKEKPKKRKTVTGKRKKGKKKVDPVSDDEEVEECQSSKNDFDLCVFSWSSLDALKKVIVDVGISDYVVICDEAHMMQSMESKRTKAALKLMESKKCLGSLMLTGTPMKNGKPSNLFPLLKAVKHPFGDKQKKYEFYFCNGQHRTIGSRGPAWDASGSSNLKQLNAHTGTHIFRMTKEECLKDLPPRKREFKQIPVAPLHELRYTQKLKDLAEVFTSAQKYGNNGGNDEILTSFQQLRQISSTAKVESIVQLANRILLEESSIVIFTNFVLVAGAIHEKLEGMDWAGELLTGQTKPDKRQAMVDRFQSGLSPVFVCTYGAGGVGLTLTAACTVILVDRPWTPGDVCQAEDRVRRIGQKRPVRSVWIRAFPVDEQIDELINHKAANSSAVVDGKDDDGQNKSAPKVSISELVKSVLGN